MHGKNVAQKSGLNRSVSEEAWSRTVTMLTYKTARLGGTLHKVPAHHNCWIGNWEGEDSRSCWLHEQGGTLAVPAPGKGNLRVYVLDLGGRNAAPGKNGADGPYLK